MKRLLFFLIVVSLLFVIHGLVRSIVDLWQKQDVLVAQEARLVALKKEHEELKAQEKIVSEPLFLEKEARDKLFLTREGEQIVLIPTGVLEEQEKVEEEESMQPVYQQWLSVFGFFL